MPADISKLTPETKRKMNMFLKACVAQRNTTLKGFDVLVTQAYRTPAYQDSLYAQGRSAAGKIVTYLKGTGKNPSLHCLGRAFDIAFIKDKKVTYNGPWKEAADIAVKCGLEAGFYWKSFQDKPHYQSDK